LRGAFPAGGDTRVLLEEVGFSREEIDGLLESKVVAEASTD
jgi:hypothetical protein